jgi:hypothetical protein
MQGVHKPEDGRRKLTGTGLARNLPASGAELVGQIVVRNRAQVRTARLTVDTHQLGGAVSQGARPGSSTSRRFESQSGVRANRVKARLRSWIGVAATLPIEKEDTTGGQVLDASIGDELADERPTRALGLINRGDDLGPMAPALVTELWNPDRDNHFHPVTLFGRAESVEILTLRTSNFELAAHTSNHWVVIDGPPAVRICKRIRPGSTPVKSNRPS